jgi:hypothetical protein
LRRILRGNSLEQAASGRPFLASVAKGERSMLKAIVVVTSVILASSAFAQSNSQSKGSSQYAPGQRMNKSTTSTSPGATEYAPGQRMKSGERTSGPGASDFAPGQQGTTVGSSKTGSKTR